MPKHIVAVTDLSVSPSACVVLHTFALQLAAFYWFDIG